MAFKLKTILIAAAVLACVLALVIQGVITRVRMQRRRKAILAACAATTGGASGSGDVSATGPPGAAAPDTIFVSIVGVHDAFLLGRTLEALFATAQQPLRVYVGMQELYDPEAPTTAVEQYRKRVAASTTMPLCLDDHVRVLRVPLQEACGAFAAREQIERMLYKDETFLMTLDAPARLAMHWDQVLVSALREQERAPMYDGVDARAAREEDGDGDGNGAGDNGAGAGSADGNATGTPARTRVRLLSASHEHIMLTAQPETRRGADVFTGPQLTYTDRPGTFLVVDRVTMDAEFSMAEPLPRFKAVAARRVAPTPAIAWSPALSFCRAARLRAVPLPNDVLFADDVEQAWMTSALLRAGWRLVHPAGTVAIVGDQAADAIATPISRYIHHTTVTSQRQRCKGVLRRSYTSLLARLGVTSAGILTARARIGLTTYPTTAEIDTKLGSHDEYLTLLSRLELQVRQTPVTNVPQIMAQPVAPTAWGSIPPAPGLLVPDPVFAQQQQQQQLSQASSPPPPPPLLLVPSNPTATLVLAPAFPQSPSPSPSLGFAASSPPGAALFAHQPTVAAAAASWTFPLYPVNPMQAAAAAGAPPPTEQAVYQRAVIGQPPPESSTALRRDVPDINDVQ